MLRLQLPSNEAEFEQMMGVVDLHLRELNVRPDARPLRGLLEISRSLGLSLRMFPDRTYQPAEGCYEGDDITIRVLRWFDSRYGEKLKTSFGPGRILFLMRHDPWVIELPRVYGSVQLFASATERSTTPEDYLPPREKPRFNVVDSIQGLTSSMRASLSPTELHAIFEHWTLGFEALSSLEAISDAPMAPEAKSDIEAAVQHAMAHPPHYGQSKWSSLQACEKALKIFLSLKEKPFPKSHLLGDLADLAEATGLPPINRSVLSAAQCSPAIRYGEIPTSLFQAFGAHVSSLKLIRHVGTNL